MIPGEYKLKDEDVILNNGFDTIEIDVVNKGDRPVQVGSHYHFYEVNNGLEFDREKAYGKRLNVPAGNAVRFEPGEAKSVQLIKISGKQVVYGFHNKVNGHLHLEEDMDGQLRKIEEE